MAKQLMFNDTARANLKDGLVQLADAVKVTLGPTGKNVILQKSWGSPKVTKDGVSVSKEIELPDPFRNMGAARPPTWSVTAQPLRLFLPKRFILAV